ncbi:hypothetical protein PanWU01x14_207390 [Parasponia andersonii]|uniref:Uncharacterized protein n=1 Tax=Parasponia andersonii TaxID=3476 RepID=A0A2P5BV27_PARAD|nr:hypothetical protein PanWU01x14_207390 [Parasponia andersonii]
MWTATIPPTTLDTGNFVVESSDSAAFLCEGVLENQLTRFYHHRRKLSNVAAVSLLATRKQITQMEDSTSN